jgi:hypothetical protein
MPSHSNIFCQAKIDKVLLGLLASNKKADTGQSLERKGQTAFLSPAAEGTYFLVEVAKTVVFH